MGVEGPCSICREISSFGAQGMPCTPMSCQCPCHRRSRILMKQKTGQVLGKGNRHIINEVKYNIPNPMEKKRVRFKPTGGMKSLNYGRL